MEVRPSLLWRPQDVGAVRAVECLSRRAKHGVERAREREIRYRQLLPPNDSVGDNVLNGRILTRENRIVNKKETSFSVPQESPHTPLSSRDLTKDLPSSMLKVATSGRGTQFKDPTDCCMTSSDFSAILLLSAPHLRDSCDGDSPINLLSSSHGAVQVSGSLSPDLKQPGCQAGAL